MIEMLPPRLPAVSRWFPAGGPGAAALAEHVLATGSGHWWADRVIQPRAVAVGCAGHVLLRGDPRALSPRSLAPLAGSYVGAPARFLPLLGQAFDRVIPWERMEWVRHEQGRRVPPPPDGVTVRRLTADDAPALAVLDDTMAWIHDSWGGPAGLAASGFGWAAFAGGRITAVACGYFLGSAYEDIAVVTHPDHRRGGLALACVTALCAETAIRGHTPSWTCSRDNRPSRLLAWAAGFRLVREYVYFATGRPVAARRPGKIPA
jgi:GNAT superfamily N-acetyltransferase